VSRGEQTPAKLTTETHSPQRKHRELSNQATTQFLITVKSPALKQLRHDLFTAIPGVGYRKTVLTN
jgi:hypothetical protein